MALFVPTGISNTGTPPLTNGSNDDHQHIRLACQACQRKKIKCDRTFPCAQCARSNLQCVASSRKPRARHAGKRAVDSELRNRISKLESLVESLSGDVGPQDGVTNGEVSTPDDEDGDEASSPTVGKYLGSPFWSSLTTEVQAIRDALEDEETEVDSTPPDSTAPQGAHINSNDFDFLIAPAGAIYIVPGALTEPSPIMQRELINEYFSNVNPMLKIMHEPTVRALLEEGAPYLGHEASACCNKALRAVIWYAATNSATEKHCMDHYGQSRADMMNQYRRSVDVHLAQADLMNTTDLATLQALTIYLASSRMSDLSRRVWTMTAFLVRIARACGLDHKATYHLKPFEQQMRRRLWHAIRFLDVFAALDRATEPLILEDTFDTPLPNNVDDFEFDEHSTSIPNHTDRFTDMCFSLLAYDAVRGTCRLSTPEYRPTGDTWQQRLDFANAFSAEVQEKYISKCDVSIPFQRLVHTIGTSMSKGMLLRAIRPIQRHVSSIPPRIDSPYVLEVATEALWENGKIYIDPGFARWRWLVWVQWHCLSVILAGLCSIRGTPLAEKAWQCVNDNYDRQLRYVADTQQGMLWRPIEKLYKKAVAFRDEGRRESLPAQPSQLPGLQQHRTMSQTVPRSPPRTQQRTQTFPLSGLDSATTSYSSGRGHHSQPHMPMGSIPLSGNMSAPMDFSFMDNADVNGDLPVGTNIAFPGAPTSSANMPQNGLTDLSMPQDGMNGMSQDLGWLDWETIMTDLNTNVRMGDLQMPLDLQAGQDWNGNLHQGLM
ncbi:hypothetical protein LTR86_000142 [Recurvomyces mirabilis]|nr:hypothetical protein LTR86_000142 [Recurvomyces mirabilis]